MKNNLRSILSLFLVTVFAYSCTDPIKDVQIKIDGSDVIKYSAVFEVAEATGAATTGLKVAVSGEDAAAIYDLGGTKNFAINNGMISFGVDPHLNPTATDPIKFEVTISGDGFVTEKIPVTIVKDQLQQLQAVKVMKVKTPPAGASGSNTTAPVTNGTATTILEFSTPIANGTTEALKLNVATGTQFLDATGKLIGGSNLVVSLMNYNALNNEAVKFFPGGSLAQDNVIVGGKEMSATFLPANFANIEMFVSGTEVKKFSKPITFSMGISSAYQNAITGTAIKAGDSLAVYSYSTSVGKWTFEKNAAVVSNGGKLSVDFTTDHLTWYMTGVVFAAPKPTVTPKTEITFVAPWLKDSSLPVTINVYRAGVLVKDQMAAVTHNGKVIINGLQFGVYKIEVLDKDKKVIYTATLNIPASHQAALSITLEGPVVTGPLVNMNLKIQCPNQTALITPPDFFLYYQEVGSTGGYKLLGLVKGGQFTTQLLDLNKTYHFRAVWGDKTKIVLNQKVTTENVLIANRYNAANGGCGCADGEVALFLQECENFTAGKK